MSSSKWQHCLELCQFVQALLNAKVARWKVHFLIRIRKDPCASFIRTDVVLLEVCKRKEECCAWSLVATINRKLTLMLLLLLDLLNISISLFVLHPCLTFLNSAAHSSFPTKCTPWFTSIIEPYHCGFVSAFLYPT
jgi:hypothetical protein